MNANKGLERLKKVIDRAKTLDELNEFYNNINKPWFHFHGIMNNIGSDNQKLLFTHLNKRYDEINEVNDEINEMIK